MNTSKISDLGDILGWTIDLEQCFLAMARTNIHENTHYDTHKGFKNLFFHVTVFMDTLHVAESVLQT
jgi:hypothetical protein